MAHGNMRQNETSPGRKAHASLTPPCSGSVLRLLLKQVVTVTRSAASAEYLALFRVDVESFISLDKTKTPTNWSSLHAKRSLSERLEFAREFRKLSSNGQQTAAARPCAAGCTFFSTGVGRKENCSFGERPGR